MIESLMEATSMMAFANDDINTIRKNSIKSELNHDYRSLCSSQTPVTEYLFGDNISEQVKAIQDTNKVSKKSVIIRPIRVFFRLKTLLDERIQERKWREGEIPLQPLQPQETIWKRTGEQQIAMVQSQQQETIKVCEYSFQIAGRLKHFLSEWNR